MPVKPFVLTPHTSQPPAEDYDSVHAAVMETERGRWFLREYARRNRNADTTLLLAAIERMEAALRIQTAIPASSHLSATSHPAGQSHAPAQSCPPGQSQPAMASSAHQLHELRDAIVLTKESLPAKGPDGRIALQGADFSSIAAGIALVTARTRSTVEHAQETAWSLRERAEKETGPGKDALDRRCNELETQAREFSTSCAQFDELAASAAMVAALLAEIEARLGGMIGAQPAQMSAPAGPAAAEAPAAAPEPDRPPRFDFSAPEPEAEASPAAPLQAMPEPAPDIVARNPSPAPVASQTTIPPQAAATASPDTWLDRLAPPVRAGDAPGPSPAATLNFNFDDEPRPAAALPNPAARELDFPLSDPAPQPADRSQAAPIVEPDVPEAKTIGAPLVAPIAEMVQESVMAPEPALDMAAPFPAADEPHDDPAVLFNPLSHAPQPEPPSAPPAAVNGAADHAAKPALRPTRFQKPADPLAPIAALSDEEKIALFS